MKTMTTQEVANRYCELGQQNKWMEIQDELYALDVVNKEPDHVAAMGIPTLTNGLDAIKAKGKVRREMIEEIHSTSCSDPVVGGSHFSVSMARDLTLKGKARTKLEEIAVFEVRDGKIILEQFFY